MIFILFFKCVQPEAIELTHQRTLSGLWFTFYYSFLRIRVQFQITLFWPLLSQEFCRLFPHMIRNQLHGQMTGIQIFHSREIYELQDAFLSLEGHTWSSMLQSLLCCMAGYMLRDTPQLKVCQWQTNGT